MSQDVDTYREIRDRSEVPPFVAYVSTGAKGEKLPAGLKWSGGKLPAIGAMVKVAINQIGQARVRGYFVEHGWLGLLVVPVTPPAWYVKQNGRGTACHVFGTELSDSTTTTV